ncbi:sigma factor-like helix-turn-helix DNA-binding protein [Streptomyces sp. ATE26]|uniref:sigma factor-like helix-turn-helix DNA-binding protein n=1 Tax=Streptomyces sp. ATE26 TaxID=2954237 RepID=UPI0024831DDA|nr:sigma factor-like helix-turn-helix DNA-binding protein [Streptomyces sp. ATE26]MDI1455237.1 sigma factor-like helix-turn-helix DNA-binding protein [Streptomyces sp. ATE26]
MNQFDDPSAVPDEPPLSGKPGTADGAGTSATPERDRSKEPAGPALPDPPGPLSGAGGAAPTRRPGRRGRPLGPIAAHVSSAHRAWLGPVREAYVAAALSSGLTMSRLGEALYISKPKISELLSGKLYPRWELLFDVAVALGVSVWPLYRLWRQAALETENKSRAWIEKSSSARGTMMATRATPPMELSAFREITEGGYRLYAGVFLTGCCDAALEETYDQLWLSWDQALASHDTRRYAFTVLRTAVMARTPHIDGRPEFSEAAFDTIALQNATDAGEAAEQVAETIALFKAMSRLADNQLDVMVLRVLHGMTDEDVSHFLGLPLPRVRSDERHAIRFLEDTLSPPPPAEEGDQP